MYTLHNNKHFFAILKCYIIFIEHRLYYNIVFEKKIVLIMDFASRSLSSWTRSLSIVIYKWIML